MEETFALATRRVVRSGVAYAVVVVLVNVLGLAGYTAVSAGAADPTAVGTQVSVLLGATVAGLVTLLCILVLLISTVVWAISAHRLTPGGPGPVGYGALAVSAVLTPLAYWLPPRVPTLAAATATEVTLRVGAVFVLVAGVLLTRARISRVTGRPLTAGHSAEPTSDDWDASKWDPEVLRDIERRRPH